MNSINLLFIILIIIITVVNGQNTECIAVNKLLGKELNSDCCSYNGIFCQNGHIIYIKLHNNILKSPIPPEIGNLNYLEELALYNNNLSGSLPPEIGNL
jgi:hypothetical protein